MTFSRAAAVGGLFYCLRTMRLFARPYGAAAQTGAQDHSRSFGPAGYLLAALVTALAGWGALVGLPYNPYERFQLLRDTDYIKGQWIYERLTFDRTPVDVAFFGTSHTLAGVDGARVERVADGAGGASVHVENLALPHYGRDLDFLLTRLLLGNQRPKLLILEADYIEFRVPHPAFPLIAETQDVFEAPVILNQGLIENLMWLAKRRLQVLERWLLSDAPPAGPSAYAGLHWDDSYRTTLRGGLLSAPRVTHLDRAVLERESAREVRSQIAKAWHYERWGWLELRYQRVFMERLAELARRSGTRLVFLYLPVYGAPAQPADAALLRRYGEIWTPPAAILKNPDFWFDKSHLNFYGGQALSNWLGEQVAASLRGAEAAVAAQSAGSEAPR